MRTLVVCLLTLSAFGSSLPKAEGESLTGQKTLLPDALLGQPSVVIWSFSREAGEKTEKWVAPLARDRVNVYSAAIIEAAPRIIRPMIRASMRRASPQPFHGRFFCITRGEQGLRQWLEVRNDKVPYVTLLGASGEVLWRHAGPFDEAAAEELMRRWRQAQ